MNKNVSKSAQKDFRQSSSRSLTLIYEYLVRPRAYKEISETEIKVEPI